MSLLDGIFDAAVATYEIDIEHAGLDLARLFPEEAESLGRAAPTRQREFVAGRTCARAALKQLGLPAVAIPVGHHRAPQWPASVVGSISHCRTRCAAVAALTAGGFVSLGVDIELQADLDDDLFEPILCAQERAAISQLPLARQGRAGMAIFSAKESIFKCQFPLTGLMLDFQDIRIDLNLAEGNFRGTFLIDALPFLVGESLSGRFRESDGLIVSGVALTR